MSTLYRKYRPQTFEEVVGQNHIKITLQHELERGEIGHAYLFCGPRGLGKTTLARLLAKSVNCQNRQAGQSEPCNKCPSCLDIMASRDVDMIEIDAASHTGVDNVRENIIENARFTPVRSKYKVFVIDEVHMLSAAAFNALLKTLEEPPAHVIFVLCTTEIHKLPQTIVSRCQRFDFKKVTTAEMVKLLEKISRAEKKTVAPGVFKSIVAVSEGCVRDAESLLGKIFSLGDDIDEARAELILPHSDFKQIAALVEYLLEKNTTAAVELINRLVEEGVDLAVFTDGLLEFLRQLLLAKAGADLGAFGLELDDEAEKTVARLAERFDYPRLIATIELFLAKRQELKSAFIQQFPLEMAAIQISEEIQCHHDDDFSGGGGGTRSEAKCLERVSGSEVKAKIKEKWTAEPKKTKTEPAKEIVEEAPKIDLLSKEDKLKPSHFVELKKVRESWPAIVAALLERNYTLASLLRISQPLKFRDEVLEIAVKSNFYKDRLDDHGHKQIIESVISDIVKASVVVASVVKEDVEPLEIGEQIETAVVPVVAIEPVMSAPKSAVEEVIGMF